MTIGSLCGLIAVSLASEALSIGFMRVGTVSLLGAAVLFILGWFPLWRREMGESWRGGGQRDSNIA